MNTLVAALADRCRERLLEEKWLLAPTRRVGAQWLDAAARAGRATLNARVETLGSMAVNLAAPALAAAGLQPAPRRAAVLLVDRALAALGPKRLRYLRDAAPGLGLAGTVFASLDALRLAGVPARRLRAGVFEDDAKGSDLKALLAAYLELLARERLVDYAAILELAIERLGKDPAALGPDTLLLVPADLEPRGLEKRMLEAVPAPRRIGLAVDAPGLPADLRFAHAVGEVNEVRAVLRACLAGGISLDEVEVLHTDPGVYVPLLYETFAAVERPGAAPGDELPVTFAEGIPCDYSRPGRALAAWVRWTAEDFPQPALVAMVREGLLALEGADGEQSGFGRLATLLRSLPVGFGRDRYLPRIAERIRQLEERRREAGTGDEAPDDEVVALRRAQIDRDLEACVLLGRLVGRLLAIAPAAGGPASAAVGAASRFLRECARSVSRLDNFAGEKLLQELASMERWLAHDVDGAAANGVRSWLQELPRATCVLGSGPRPGCLHVDRVPGGGHSGRPHTFVVGLDDGRFPGAGLQDPLLLDRERARLGPEVQPAVARLEASVRGFAHLLGRLRGAVRLSWPGRHLTDDRELFPSPVLLAAFRDRAGNPGAELTDLLRSTGLPASFAPPSPEEALSAAEWWLWRLTGDEQVVNAGELLARRAPHLARGEEAAAARAGDAFTAWDGFVPRAGADLDPTAAAGKVLSSNGLEAAGACPLRFFFKYALEIAPPEELAIDASRWLDPLRRGSLLHGLFEDFVRELVAAGRLPSLERDRPRLLELLEARVVAELAVAPPPSAAVYDRERRELAQVAETFLRVDEEFCREHRSAPAYLEASIGMPQPAGTGTALDTPEPVAVALPDGGAIRTRGRVDRIDRVGDAPGAWSIWDYKTGGSYGFAAADPFVEGRKVQSYLYLRMVEARLRSAVGPAEQVVLFGYFFPGLKTMGERISWTPEKLREGGRVLQLLSRALAAGAFVPTTEAGDCTYCDYRAACGDVVALAAASRRKVAGAGPALAHFRELRAKTLAEAGP